MSEDFFPTDRSRIMTYQRCPHRRLIEYHWDGRGIVHSTVAVPLATGGAIHLGLQRLLEGASPDEAVQDALRAYRQQVQLAGFQDTHDTHQEYLVKEQLALTEVMIRAWALKRLPLFQEQYNIIEIEREAPPVELAPGVFMFRRPDGVLENKHTGFYEVLSFKTAKQYGYKADSMNMVDMQGISETWAVAQKYGEERVGPVLMEFLVTGPRKLLAAPTEDVADALTDDEDVAIEVSSNAPLRVQWNPLIRAWRDNYGNVSWRFKIPEAGGRMPTMAKFFDPDYGSKKKTKAPYQVETFPVWELMPVKEWFDKMAAGQVFPTTCDPFDKMFVSRKYDRLPYELTDWQRQVASQEATIRGALRILNDPSESAVHKQVILDGIFPKYRHSCQYPTPCPFRRICWEGLSDPLSAGFQYRRPNHPEQQPVIV